MLIPLVFLLISGLIQRVGESLPINPCTAKGNNSVTFGAVITLIQENTLKAGARSVIISKHAAKRMLERSISADHITGAVEVGKLFAYQHNNLIKIGYYHEASKIFLALDQQHKRIITVIRHVPPEYILRLMK